jgi:hypothetical protein
MLKMPSFIFSSYFIPSDFDPESSELSVGLIYLESRPAVPSAPLPAASSSSNIKLLSFILYYTFK